MLKTKEKDSVQTLVGEDRNVRFKVSKEDEAIIKTLMASVGCNVDKKTNVISLSFKDQDPLVAAIMIDTIQMRLRNYIYEYRTKKAIVDLNHYMDMLDDAEKKYESTKQEYIDFCEANYEVQQASFVVEQTALENRMSREFAITNQIRLQVQSAEAKVQESKPVFTVIESPKMANKPSGNSRKTIALGYVLIGLALNILRIILFVKKDKK